MKNFFYGTATRRQMMRFIEIFVITGALGLINSPEIQSLVPAGLAGLIATGLKMLRDGQKITN